MENELKPEELEKEPEKDLEEMDPDELLQTAQTLNAQKKHWRKKAKDAEAEAARKSAEPPAPEPKKPEPKSTTDEQWRKKMDFITGAGRGLSADEIDRVVAFAEGKGISYDLAMEDPYIKAGMETIRTQKKAEAAAVIDETDKSDIEKRYTVDQLKAMPTKDLIKLAQSAKK